MPRGNATFETMAPVTSKVKNDFVKPDIGDQPRAVINQIYDMYPKGDINKSTTLSEALSIKAFGGQGFEVKVFKPKPVMAQSRNLLKRVKTIKAKPVQPKMKKISGVNKPSTGSGIGPRKPMLPSNAPKPKGLLDDVVEKAFCIGEKFFIPERRKKKNDFIRDIIEGYKQKQGENRTDSPMTNKSFLGTAAWTAGGATTGAIGALAAESYLKKRRREKERLRQMREAPERLL